MYTLYIGNKNYSSWSLRPWVLMRALAIPFEEQVEFFLEGSCWEKFRIFSPNGLVPCLHDGKLVIWESLGIVEYLAEGHAGVWPQDDEARAWARCATSEMHAGFSALRNECPMNCGVRIVLNSISPGLQQNLDRLDELWSEGLDRFGGPYLAGNSFTAVDAFYAPVAFRVQTFNLKLSDTAMAYVQRMLKLDVMLDWYEAALSEPWREEDHDQQTFGAGRLVADLRAPVPG
ncbi:glutathione S-transferase family protein [Pseudomonadota bacterium]